MTDLLRGFLAERGVLEAAPEAHDKLESYVDLLRSHARAANLIGPLDRQAIISDLIIDALLPALVAPPTGRLIDVGSGAGIPGIPLAICHPDLHVHLVEPRQRRAAFLRVAIRRLGLQATVTCSRLEELDREVGPFDVAAAKAFRPPLEWLEAATPWLAESGRVYLYLSAGTWPQETTTKAQSMGFEPLGSFDHPTRCGRFGLVLRGGRTVSTALPGPGKK